MRQRLPLPVRPPLEDVGKDSPESRLFAILFTTLGAPFSHFIGKVAVAVHLNDVDRVLVAGSYLEQIRNAQDFTAAEVRDLVKEAKWPPPINVNDAINRNIKKGFFDVRW